MNQIRMLIMSICILLAGHVAAYPLNPNKAINLTEFAEKVAKQIYSYNFENIDYNLNTLKPYFTDRGYRRFRKALAISKNVDYVRNHKMQVTGVLLDQAKLEKQLNKNEWVYRMKLKVTFRGPAKEKQNTLWVLMRIVRYHQNSAFEEIGVDQVVVYPTSLEPRRV